MLPKAAFTPPWAATVCERVGNSFVITAVLKPYTLTPPTTKTPYMLRKTHRSTQTRAASAHNNTVIVVIHYTLLATNSRTTYGISPA